MLIPLLLSLLMTFQNPPVDQLIQQLGDADPARREEAVGKLRAIGPAAKVELQKAVKSSDTEVRTRAKALLDQFERERLQVVLEAEERKNVFPRVTIHATDVPRREVLAELSRQSHWVWDPGRNLSLEEKVTAQGENIPMIQALDSIGVYRSMLYKGKTFLHKLEDRPNPGMIFDDGVRLSITRKIWSPKGEPLGWIFETNLDTRFDGEVLWRVASVKTDRDWAVETCAIHSPDRVYVPEIDLKEPQLVIQGTRIWFCPTPVEFKAPRSGDSWELGSCKVTVNWPSVRVRMSSPIKESLLDKTLSSDDIQFKVKPGREKDMMGVGIGGGGGGRYGGRFGNKNLAWCGCEGQPATKDPHPPKLAQEKAVPISFGSEYALEDILSISITFHKPVEDPFRVTSPPIK